MNNDFEFEEILCLLANLVYISGCGIMMYYFQISAKRGPDFRFVINLESSIEANIELLAKFF